MKDIKSYVIGFLSCACLFLIMGQTKSDSQIGKYQAFADERSNWMIDTKTGKLYQMQSEGAGKWNENKYNYWWEIQKEWKGINP